MRKAVPGLLFPLLLVACSPPKDQDVTRQVLVSAQTARAGVAHLLMRYGEILDPDGDGPGTPGQGWEDVAAWRESAEGRAARKLLSDYAQPIRVDPAFARAPEIEGLSRATAELVSLALEPPRGTWESFAGEVGESRARLDRTLAEFERGTKYFILIEATTETNRRTSAYAEALVRARGAGPE